MKFSLRDLDRGVIEGLAPGVTFGQRVIGFGAVECSDIEMFMNIYKAMLAEEEDEEKVEGPRLALVEYLVHEKERMATTTTSSLPLNDQLYPFQKHIGGRIVGEYDGKCIMDVDPGLGKTPISLSVCKAMMSSKPENVLILTKKKLFDQWKQASRVWLGVDDSAITLVVGGKGALGSKVTISTYQTARVNQALLARKWDAVIFDESHLLKNGETKQSKALMGLAQAARITLLLSGTPIENSVADLYNQAKYVFPQLTRLVGTYEQFIQRYCSAERIVEKHTNKRYWKLGKARYQEELKLLIPSFLLRFSSQDRDEFQEEEGGDGVGEQLTQHIIKFKLEDEAMIQRLKRLEAQRLQAQGKDEHDRLYQEQYLLLGPAKFDHLSKWILAWLAQHPGDKLIVFAVSLDLMKQYKEMLAEHGHTSAIIDGSTTPKESDAIVKHLAAMGDLTYRVGILSIGTTDVGLNIVPGTFTIVYAQTPFKSTTVKQCNARCARIGQVHHVHSYLSQAMGTLDDQLMRSMARKAADITNFSVSVKRCKLEEE